MKTKKHVQKLKSKAQGSTGVSAPYKSLILTLGCLVLPASGYAQTSAGSSAGMTGPSAVVVPPPPTPTPTPVPTNIVSGAPATIGFGQMVTGADIGKFGGWLLLRLHKINIEGRASDMIRDGVSSKNFVAGFTTEGTLVYEYELDSQTLESFDQTGRAAGIQLVPFRIQINADGSKRLSATALAFRNMNAIQASTQAWRDAEVFTVIDQIDIMTFTWDNKSTFSNLRTLDMDIARVKAKLGLLSGANNNYLALRAGGMLGVRWHKFYGDLPMPVTDNASEGSSGAFNTDFSGGIEVNLQSAHGTRLNLQSEYVGGYTKGIALLDTAKYQRKAEEKANYEVKIEEWKTAKAAYDTRQGKVSNDVDFELVFGSKKPTDPGAPDGDTSGRRNYGYLQNSVDFSIPVGSGRPKRVGVNLQYNRPITDRIGDFESGIRIDTKSQFRQVFVGKIYFSF